MSRTVQILFYKPIEGDCFMNRLVGYFDPPFCHVEVRFENGMASSIFSGEKVFFKQRTYANPNYVIEAITVPDASYMDMYRVCAERERVGMGFDSFGMYTSVLPIIKPIGSGSTFCSRHVTEVLQAGKVSEVMQLDASKMSPSRLYQVLKRSKRTIIDSVPYKMNKMLAETHPQATARRNPMENPKLNPSLYSQGSIPAISFKRS
eukprot:768228-Hanusia_phi.AAC.4